MLQALRKTTMLRDNKAGVEGGGSAPGKKPPKENHKQPTNLLPS